MNVDMICKQVLDTKLIAIVRGVPEDTLLPIAEALHRGGVRMIECTFDHARPDCVPANARMISRLRERMDGRMEVGAGTVVAPEEVDAAVEAGASFIISPNTDARIIGRTRELGAVSMPGALTPTEIAAAWNAGAHFVKLFPANALGTEYIQAVRAPLSHIPLFAVGGVQPENVRPYLEAGIVGFGVGSPLLPKGEIERGNYEAVTARARAFADAIFGAARL